MSVLQDVIGILAETLQSNTDGWDESTGLLGEIPEFDSMAVVTVITALEENLEIFVEDDEINAETFETIGTLCAFVESKLG